MIPIPNIDIFSLGGVNLDLCARVPEFPGIDGEIEISQLEELPGGSAANYIVGVARLGVRAGFIGKVGDDNYGQKLLHEFIQEEIDISQVQVEKNTPSGMCLIPIDKDGNRQIFSFRGANAKITSADLDLNFIKQASHLHITSPPLEVAEFAAKFSRENDITISYDPGGKVIRRGIKFLIPILRNTDIFLPSRTELEMLYPRMRNPLNAAYSLLNDYGIQIVAIKLGANGCLIVNRAGEVRVKGFNVKVIDTTGAGDSFAAAFTVGIIKGWDLSKCAKFANAASAITITQVGARTALPTMNEISIFLKTT